MTLGISSYTFGWAVGIDGYVPPHAMDAHALLNFAQTEGISVVQICDNLPLVALSATERRNVLGRARDADISIEVGSRGLTEENLHAHLDLAEEFGAPLLRFVIDAPYYQPPLSEAARVLRTALPRLADTDLVIGIENHDRFPARELRAFIEDLNHSQVGVCLDTVNSLGCGEGIEHVLTHLAPVTVNLHIKDFTIVRVPYLMAFSVEGSQAGQGMLDIPAVVDTVRKYGRCETATLELWTRQETSLQGTIRREAEWARESLRYLRPFFPG